MTESDRDAKAAREVRLDEKLLACPFCGIGCAMLDVEFGKLRFALCGGCSAQGPAEKTAKKAVKAWNTRAVQP